MWNIKYPNVNNEILNLDWVINKVKELNKRIDDFGDEILQAANQYTDEQLAGYQQQVEEIRREFTALVTQLDNDFDDLKLQINQSLLIMDRKIDDLQAQLEADIVAVNARTDLAIRQNNDYILSEVGRFLSQIKVLNYFTGDYCTIQEMFDYLATLHAVDGITVTDLVNRQKTVNTLVSLNMTMTQLAMYGNSIIPA